MSTAPDTLIRLALVDDVELVAVGLSHMFDEYRDRVELLTDVGVTELDDCDVDLALYDPFGRGTDVDDSGLCTVLERACDTSVAVYSWVFDDRSVGGAIRLGARGYLSKSLAATSLIDAIERIHAGATVSVGPFPSAQPPESTPPAGEPSVGLTDREAEILTLIGQGRSNAEIAAMTYLSINSIKSHIRNAYRKISVTSRTQAVLWGVNHGVVDRRGLL